MRGTGGGMECLVGDAVPGLLSAGRRVAHWKPASNWGWLAGLVLGDCKVSRVMMVGLLSSQGVTWAKPRSRAYARQSTTARQGPRTRPRTLTQPCTPINPPPFFGFSTF